MHEFSFYFCFQFDDAFLSNISNLKYAPIQHGAMWAMIKQIYKKIMIADTEIAKENSNSANRDGTQD